MIARNEQEEATAIAVAMREAIEIPGRTAALVTPDRALARRVATEVKRWGLNIDDSAGRPLDRQPAGEFCRLAIACLGPRIDPVDMLSLLKHPLAAMGLSAAACRQGAQAIEMAALRGERFAGTLAELPSALIRARASLENSGADAPRVPRSRRRLSRTDWSLAEDVAQRLAAAFAPITKLAEEFPDGTDIAAVAQLLTELLVALATVSDTEVLPLWPAGGGEALARLLTGLMDEDEAGALTVPWPDLPAFLTTLMADIAVPQEPGGEPRLHIWGTLEARLQAVDLLVLGGLDVSVWPAATTTDPWLSRAMRAEIGLEPPERRLGLSAHDFVQGL